MPTTTPFPPAPDRARRRRGGFTLTEVIVASSISALLLVGVLSSVLMVGRSGFLLNNYVEMEQEARTALETFALDARVAQRIAWHRADTGATLVGVTLTAPDNAVVRYDYQSATGRLVRTDSAGTRRTLISGIRSLTFTAYQYADGPGIQLIDPATQTTDALNGLTKMVQISLSSRRTRATLADATNNVVSARYVLRNKKQTV